MKHITMVGICLWSLVCAQAYASIYAGKVVGVSDGDTLTVLTGGRILEALLSGGVSSKNPHNAWIQ